VARGFSRLGMYHQEVQELGGPAYEVRGQALSSLGVDQFMRRDFVVLPQHLPLAELLPLVLACQQEVFPVVDGQGRWLGAVRLGPIRTQLRQLPEDVPVIAADLAEEVPTLGTEATLEEAAELLAEGAVEKVVVVDGQSQKPVGLVSPRDLLRASIEGAPG